MSASGNLPMTTRVGLAKSSTAVPWRRNSGFVKVRLVGSPASSTARHVPPTGSVLRMTTMSDGSEDHRELGQHSVDLAKVAQAVIADRRPDAHQDDARCIRRDVVDGQPSGCDGRIEALLEPRFVDRDPAGTEGRQSPGRGLDEANLLPEPGEPDGRDEADVAATDHGG